MTALSTPLDLPAPLSADDFTAMREEHSERPDGLSNATLNIIANNVGLETAALIRQLANTTMSTQKLTICIELCWNRGEKADIILHNALLLADRLQSETFEMQPALFIRAVIGLNRHGETPGKITAVEQLEGAAAFIRFIAVALKDGKRMISKPVMTGYSDPFAQVHALSVANPFLGKFLLHNPEKADRVISYVMKHPVGHSRKSLEPLWEFLDADIHTSVDQGWL